MPAPTSHLSSDHYLYKYLYTQLAENICVVHPNYVSIANLLISTPLAMYALLNRWSLGAVIIVFLFHNILDCMDGSIARACDKKSKLGAFLDSASDIVFMIVVVLTVLYIMTQKYGLFDWKTGVTAVALSVTTFVLSIGTDYIHHDDFESNPVINLVHDNTTVLFVVVGGFMWWLVNRA